MNEEERNEERGARSEEIADTSQQAPSPAKAGDAEGSVREAAEVSKEAEYLAGWKRAMADYDNLVKEMDRKKAEYADWATERVLTELLPAIDQYEVAMSFAPSLEQLPEDQKKAFGNWITGLRAVQSLWMDAVKEIGLTRVPVDGKFDPTMHEAVGEESSDTVPSGNVIRATMNGYMLKGKVIRCAKVIVSK